jgi:hypothetical protein
MLCVGSLSLGAILGSCLSARADFTNRDGIVITNGVVVITTRSATDAYWRQQSSSGLWDADDNRGPGIFSPGDAAMGILLEDNGYTTRMVPEKVLSYTSSQGTSTVDWNNDPIDPNGYYEGGNLPSGGTTSASNVLYSAMLVIVSGSGSSADMPPPNTNGIPIIMGEHSCLGDNTTSLPRDHSELFLYGNKNSGNLTAGNNPGLYMRVVDPNHPIMKGIPLDAQGRVKIFRDPYPQENLHSASSAKPNYEISWTAVDCSEGKSVPAPGLSILGVLDSATNQVVFAVMDRGGQLADTSDSASQWAGYTTAPARLVHFFVNEGGSGNTRRAFNALTDIGRVIFVRTCKWAMGETLAPYKPLGIIDVGFVTPQKIRLSWQGSAGSNYKILATDDLQGPGDFTNWQTVAQDIPGADGPVSRTLSIAGGTQYAYLRVAPMP